MSPAHLLLATTSKALLLIDPADDSVRIVDSGREHYYGIAPDPDHYYVGNRLRSNASPIPKEQEKGKILLFDRSLRFQREICPPDFPLRDIHQIALHAGALWVTCSFDNLIAIFDGSAWHRWYPLGTPPTGPVDQNHFNSISAFANQLCIVAHNWGTSLAQPSEMLFFELPTRELVRRVPLGFQAHNAWLHGDELMTCSSGEGKLRGIRGTEVSTGGFPRGIAYLGDEVFVGISEFSPRKDRDDSKGEIAVFDRNWCRRRAITLGNHGMITDLVTIPAADALRWVEGTTTA